MSRARAVVARTVKTASSVVDRVVPSPPGVVVLAYHQVGAPSAGPVNLPPALFEEQVAWLASELHPVTLDAAAELLADPSDTPLGTPPPVVVTFDDGTADFVDVALPMLARYGVPVTLYLATRFVEEGRSFWDDGTVLSWGALRDACSTGIVTIGSHTHDHLLLHRAPVREAADDLDRSIGLISDRLGVAAHHFAYPKALAPSPAVAGEVARRFRTAALAGSRPNRPGRTDLQRLARTPIQTADGTAWFRRKALGGLRLEGMLREVVDRRRHAGASQ